MNEERFLESLGEQAREELDCIAVEAEGREQQIRHEAEEECVKIREEILSAARRTADALRSRILNTARIEAAQILLTSRHQLIEKIIDRLREKLMEISEHREYRQILEELFDECLIPEGACLQCRPSDHGLLDEIARRRGCRLCLEDADFTIGGLVVRTGDGRFIERNTFDDRIGKARSRIEQTINARLFQAARHERKSRRGR